VASVLQITDRKQLWNVCFKSPYARVEIPELEFEISAGGATAWPSTLAAAGRSLLSWVQ
jgi:C4-type Zn-finger protein